MPHLRRPFEMQTHTADALVLRTYRYGEADRIVVFLTEEQGKKRGVAKNATNSRRRFGAALEPLTHGRVTYVERETRDLVRVDRIEPRQSPLRATAGRPPGEAAHALGHTAYFAELLDEWSPESSPNERLFRLGVAMSDALCRGGSVEALARYFEYWLLRLEGVYPALVVCPRCGRATLGQGAWLAMGERAYVCLECGHGRPRLSPEAVACVRGFARQAPADVVASDVPPRVLREVEGVHDRLMALHLERELRSARVVRELGPES
jgi:DNA repair protein RecO (recombination protein O)